MTYSILDLVAVYLYIYVYGASSELSLRYVGILLNSSRSLLIFSIFASYKK